MTQAKGKQKVADAQGTEKEEMTITRADWSKMMEKIEELSASLVNLNSYVYFMEKMNDQRYRHLHNHDCNYANVEACKIAGKPKLYPLEESSEEEEEDPSASEAENDEEATNDDSE